MTLETIAIVSDTHLASRSERIDLLSNAYDIIADRGISDVFHSGDITDGNRVYKGQEFFLKVTGADAQADYIAEHYPKREGVTTHFILGNHDMSHFDREGADIGRLISHLRPDLDYLGQYYARVKFGSATMDLVHPGGGFQYAISYGVQRYVNELEGGSKANIIIFGHWHRTGYFVYRNIHCVLGGAFQDQNDYTRRRGLQPNKGFWILQFDERLSVFIPKWHAYYELKDDRIVRQMSKIHKPHPKKKRGKTT